MSSILISALAGAAGGAVGAGLAWVIGRALGRRPAWLTILPVLGIGIALTAARGLQPSFGDRLMAGMDDLPSVQALKAHYPRDYEKLRAQVAAITDRSAPEEMGALTANVFATVLQRQFPKADAESTYAFQRVVQDYAVALQPVDAAACVAMTEGNGPPPALAKVRTAEIERKDMDATTRVLVQTATRPAAAAKPMSFDELVRISSAALATMPDKDQDVAITVLREERDPRTPDENRIMCAFNLALADQLLSLGPVAGGEKFRAMQAMK